MYHAGNTLIDPEALFEAVGLLSNQHVAIFGCGRTGHVVFPAAKKVGKDGIVYAVDIMKDVLTEVHKRASLTPIHQIHTVWSDVEQVGKTAIPKESLDVVFIVNILPLTKNQTNVLTEAIRLTKKYGRIIVADWTKCELPFCPPQNRLVNFGTLKEWALTHGLSIEHEIEAGKYHTGIVFRKEKV
ncbi:MAG: methyltransferase domain-containing protein [Candidatus Magasanikbacteria bacterium]|nr:methyltransferase domain-containing protein [Candidatus Magasanikbacteria bacterium]